MAAITIRNNQGKIKKIMERFHMDQKAAENHSLREENDSRSYIKHYFNEDWNAAHLYDLALDMGKISIEQSAEMICDNLKHKVG